MTIRTSAAAILLGSGLAAVVAADAAAPESRPAASRVEAASREPIPWIRDDWARAMAEGQRLHRPVFVEAWAPW